MTHTLDPANAPAHHNCSIRRASGFVQTPFSSLGRIVGYPDRWPLGTGAEFPKNGASSTGRCNTI